MKPPAATEAVAYLDTDTPLGPLRLAASDTALRGAWFLDQDDLPAPSPAWRLAPSHAVLCQARAELAEWFAGRRREFEVALEPLGTPFQQAVWQALLALPFGATCSYGELASAIGKPKAVRAAAQAIGRNPISIIIPCHRVIGRDTSLTGFGGGLPRKQALLAHEGHRYLGRHARTRRVDSGQAELPW
ncbi:MULTISPECIES: methylated-DNA--[protein]-cysteine S-methyltransferase [Bordetella]|uniref:Methylated-DNA--protein-cysteine methyltransferase n=2 Tax=Bordetella TaxID=517 RepID=A0A261VI26_9BORD|nr:MULTISPECIES: methylated-DNA--[protein]-cysteine S-methyltransferase [Bordetella]MDM9560343.1 methylated-DNA--[protein]-cysteine S-methyltransferase [Bordetella petrii]OZI72803.1 cysteine methyltransferase [Bordetella genomosp. 2]